MSARRPLPRGAVQACLALALLGGWELLPTLRVVDPVFVPPLHAVLVELSRLWRAGQLAHHTALSAGRALGGFAAAVALGTPLGFLLAGPWPRLRRALLPLLDLAAQLNPVVLFHVVILFLGIGEAAKVFIIAWLCTATIATSALAGVAALDPQLLRIGRAFALGPGRLFLRVVLPAAAPALFTGLRLAAGQACVMLVGAEMMGASSGLGWFVVQSQESYHAPRIFAGAVVITALALLADAVLKRIEGGLVTWTPSVDERWALLGHAGRARTDAPADRVIGAAGSAPAPRGPERQEDAPPVRALEVANVRRR